MTTTAPAHAVDRPSLPAIAWVMRTVPTRVPQLPGCPVEICAAAPDESPNQTAVRALAMGIRNAKMAGAPWVGFLEDDLEYCADFDGATARWLADHAPRPSKVVSWGIHPLYAPYDLRPHHARGETTFRYMVDAFYGSQAFVASLPMAEALQGYLTAAIPEWSTGQNFDLLIKAWAKAEGWEAFLATCPSFVQHRGTVSTLGNDTRFHTAPSWPGPDWTYVSLEDQ